MESEIFARQVEKRIGTRVKRQMENTQREYFLNEQMKAIQKEIGDEEGRDEFAEIEDKIKRTKLSKEAHEKATHGSRSFGRCRRCQPKRRSCEVLHYGRRAQDPA
jgi:ATP-dependent Lon protease